MPKGVYRALQFMDGTDQEDPIHIDGEKGTAIQTSRQPVCRLLCADCEKQLSNNGENYSIPLLSNGVSFKLAEAVASCSPTVQSQGKSLWMPSAISEVVDYDKLAYFILSIVWRFSVANTRPRLSYRGALGARYSEAIRGFLLGEMAFPNEITISMAFDRKSTLMDYLSIPTFKMGDLRGNRLGFHSFQLPGVVVTIFVGGDSSFHGQFEGPVRLHFHETDFHKTGVYRSALRMANTSVPKGKLAKIEKSDGHG